MAEKERRQKKPSGLVKATGALILSCSSFLASSFPGVSFSPKLGTRECSGREGVCIPNYLYWCS